MFNHLYVEYKVEQYFFKYDKSYNKKLKSLMFLILMLTNTLNPAECVLQFISLFL